MAPSTVTPLSAAQGAPGQIVLSWTAPGVFAGSVLQAFQLHVQTFPVADVGGSAEAWWNSAAGFKVEQSLYSEASGSQVSRIVGPGAPDSELALALQAGGTYYCAIRSADDMGFTRDFWSGITTATAVVVPVPQDPVPMNVRATAAAASTLDFAWTLDSPATEVPVAALSADAAFTSLVSSEALAAGTQAAHYAGLTPNTTYWFKVKISTVPDHAYSAAVSTWTTVASPASAALGPAATGSMLVSWSAAGNPPDTVYSLEFSSAGFPAPVTLTTAASVSFGNLPANTIYQARVAAIDRGGRYSAFSTSAQRATLALAPTPAGTPLVEVFTTSATLAWIPRPAAPEDQSCYGYRLAAYSSATYSVAYASSATADVSLSSLTIRGLVPGVTFYFRVASLNPDGAENWLVLDSTMSRSETYTGATVDASVETVVEVAVEVAVSSAGPAQAMTNVRMEVPPSAFPDGTVVSVNTEPEAVPPPAAGDKFTAAGSGVDLSAGGLQPDVRVLIRMRFDSVRLPRNWQDVTLSIGRYDPVTSRWQLLPTTVDAAALEAVAETDHFSLFNLFVVRAAVTLDDVKVYPIPWKPGSGDPRFDSAAIAFRQLTYPARVTIYTLVGEKVWKGEADNSGALDWDGTNQAGRRAASGVYLAIIEGGLNKVVRRVVIIR